MITVVRAWTQEGWNPDDHLRDDSRMDEVIGQRFATLAPAVKAIESRAWRDGYVSFEFSLEGQLYLYDGSHAARIPGRSVQRVKRLGKAQPIAEKKAGVYS